MIITIIVMIIARICGANTNINGVFFRFEQWTNFYYCWTCVGSWTSAGVKTSKQTYIIKTSTMRNLEHFVRIHKKIRINNFFF